MPSSPTPNPASIPYSGQEAADTLNSGDANQGKEAPIVVPVEGTFGEAITEGDPEFVSAAGSRLYPSNAARSNTTAKLIGAGSNSDIFTFTLTGTQKTKRIHVQNNTANLINIFCGSGAQVAATQGDDGIVGGQNAIVEFGEDCTWVAIYGTANDTVNQTAAGGIVLYALI